MTTNRTYSYRHLTPEELYALEMEARRLRAEAIADALKRGFAALKGIFERPAKVRHA